MWPSHDALLGISFVSKDSLRFLSALIENDQFHSLSLTQFNAPDFDTPSDIIGFTAHVLRELRVTPYLILLFSLDPKLSF